MEPQNGRKPPEQPQPAAPSSPVAKKRFRIEKLDERIAPRKYNSSASGSSVFTYKCPPTTPY